MHKLATCLTAAAITGLFTTAALANSVTVVGDGTGSTENTGSTFTADVSYDFNAAASRGELSIHIANTSSVDSELTGLLFNIDGLFDDISLQVAPNSSYSLVTNANGAPFGSFDAGAALGGKFLGGGKPQPGIDEGSSGLFKFFLTGGDVMTLTASDFVTQTSSQGNNSAAFLVRFKDVGANGGSDKVPGTPTTPNTPDTPNVIPTPAALPAGLLALGVLGLRRRRLA